MRAESSDLELDFGAGGGDPGGAPKLSRLNDQEARDTIRTDLDSTLFVEAAAGTGKTTELVRRMVEVLKSGRGTLKDVVAVTFTEKAAGEMKLRLRERIERARSGAQTEEERENLARALEELELANIGTIHGFCADLLRERPVEAGVDPSFDVAEEEASGRILNEAFDRWFRNALEDPPPGVRRALRRPYPRNSGGPRAALRRAAGKLIEQRDFTAPWARPDWDREATLDRAVELLEGLADLASRAYRDDDYLAKNLKQIQGRVRELKLREEVAGRELGAQAAGRRVGGRVAGRDYDQLEAWLRFVRQRWRGWHWRGRNEALFGDGISKADALAQRDEVRDEVRAILDTADADLAADLHDELWPVVEAYQEAKRRTGRLDFVDLLIRARDLLRDNAEILAYYRGRFTHFFVDEFQDTDPLQVEILLHLCSEDPDGTPPEDLIPAAGKLFVVGDPKQSIYRFRRADVMLYERTKRRLAAAGAKVMHLSTSFRSQPRLQAAVNGAFGRRMHATEDGSNVQYMPLEPFRDDVETQPAVIALPVPRPYGKFGTVWPRAIDDSLPGAVGAFVQWLLKESGWQVPDPERPERMMPIRARNVCLLFRRLQSWGADVTQPYVRELEARAIPHVLVGGRSFHDREEVLALRNSLRAIEWPDDRLAVYAALRGPLFALGDGALFEFRSRVGTLNPLAGWGTEARDEEVKGLKPELRAVAEVLELIGELHRSRNWRPLDETIRRLLRAVRAHAGIASGPTGEQALANVLRLVDRARAFERAGAASFRAFLDGLEVEAERGQAEQAPVVEEGTDGVRMMTVHKAKGLEFHVVILADMTCLAAREPTRYVDPASGLWAQPLCGAIPQDVLDHRDVETVRERAEADRLTYVAATRARDLLVVPTLGDGRDGKGGRELSGMEEEWWLDALNPALFPPVEASRSPAPADALGAPSFGEESVVERVDRQGRPRSTPQGSVAPGLHTSSAGTPVVWWDPAALNLDPDPPAEDRRRPPSEPDRTEQRDLDAEKGRLLHEQWGDARIANRRRGSRASLSVTTVRSAAKSHAAVRPPTDSPPSTKVQPPADTQPSAGPEPSAAEQPGGAPPAESGTPADGPGPSAANSDLSAALDVSVDWVAVPRPDEETANRPGGERFGSLVHEILALTPLDAGGGEVLQLAQALGRTMDCTAAEIRAAGGLAARALKHELMERARAAAETDARAVRREVPLFYRAPPGILAATADLAPAAAPQPDTESAPVTRQAARGGERGARQPDDTATGEAGTVIEGVADLAFREVTDDGPRWTVVDYKTDRDPSETRPQYEAQVALYCAAVRAATGEPVRGIVLLL